MEKFAEERLEICKKCPIMRMTEYGMKCDDRKWISPDGKEGSFLKKDGWKKGCGCMLQYKVRTQTNHCIAGLW